MQAAQGDLAAALKSFRDSFAIRRAPGPSPIPTTRCGSAILPLSYSEFADVYKQSGDTPPPQSPRFEREKKIMARLAKLAPDNPEWQRDLAWFDELIDGMARGPGLRSKLAPPPLAFSRKSLR